jgi:hypothetical protein
MSEVTPSATRGYHGRSHAVLEHGRFLGETSDRCHPGYIDSFGPWGSSWRDLCWDIRWYSRTLAMSAARRRLRSAAQYTRCRDGASGIQSH